MIKILLIALTLSPALLHAVNTVKNPNPNVTHYEIRLDVLDFSSRVVYGETTVIFTASSSAIDTLRLELRQLTVDSVFLDTQQPVSFSHQGDHLHISLPLPVPPGDTAAITVFYHGLPYHEGWGGFHFSGQNAFNLGVGFTSYPPNLGKAWFPCVDNFFDRALFDYHIRVSEDKKAICGGLLQSVTPHGDGTHTFHWKTAYTIPTYLASVAIGDYVAVTDTFAGMERDIPITIYVRPADVDKVAGSFANLHSIMHIFENRFGPYPFERIGYTGTAQGAMEHASNVAYPAGLIDNTLNYEWLYTHEIAHMWFGNKVTCGGPGEMWLNEGWAVWTELFFREELYDRETALAVQRSKQQEVLRYLHTPQGDGSYLALHNIPPAQVYGKTVYQKGGLVVHTLRHYLGDNLFFPAVQAYLDTFAYNYASSYDLKNTLSQHSGVDLTSFFDSWVFQPGFPHYSIDSVLIMNQEAEVFVRQRSKGRDFIGNANIVEITFMDSNFQQYSDTMMFDGQTGSMIFELPFEPALAMMDYHEKMCDATTDRARFISNTGTLEFTDTFSRLLIQAVEDTTFIRITHHWVAPDPLIDQQPGLMLSPYRHWHVDGIIPEGFDSEIHFWYQRTGFLDNDLIINPADSLVILYRPDTGHDWHSVPFSRFGPWSVGWIMLDTLRLGEYTLAIWDATHVGSREMVHKKEAELICFPNPAKGSFTIAWEAQNSAMIRITNLEGKLLEELKAAEYDGTVNISTAKYKPGVYFVSLLSPGGETIAGSKIVIKP
jgi:hypothetical protein